MESAKNIILDGEPTVDPMIEIGFLGKTKTTSVKKDVGRTSTCKWNEHVFMDTGNVPSKEIEAGLIELRIMNKGFFQSDIIGYFPISSSTVYNLDKHVVHNQIIAMTNPKADDKNKISAFLIVSINLTGPGDSAVALKMGSDKEVSSKKPWMPTNIEKQYKQFYFKFIRAENLPIMDTFGTIDAYIYHELNKTSKVKTRVYTMKDNEVIWNQEILIPVELPFTNDAIVFNLYDYIASEKDAAD